MHLSGLSPGMNRYSSQPISYTVINSTRYLYECFPSAPKKKRRCLRAVHEPRCCFGLNLAQSLISSSTLVWSQTWYPALASSMCWWRWQPEALQLVCSLSSISSSAPPITERGASVPPFTPSSVIHANEPGAREVDIAVQSGAERWGRERGIFSSPCGFHPF